MKTKETIETRSDNVIFLHVEAFLKEELKKIEKEFGKEIAEFCGLAYRGLMLSLVVNAQMQKLEPGPAVAAFVKLIAKLNERLDAYANSISNN